MRINKIEAVEKLWEPAGMVPPKSLEVARSQLHELIQIPAAVGLSLLEEREDNSQINLEWNTVNHALVGNPLRADQPVSVGVRFDEPALIIVEQDGTISDVKKANGETIESLFEWTREVLEERGIDGSALSLEREYDLPPSPQQNGEPFDCSDAEPFTALASYFSNADLILRAAADSHTHADPVRCWPHHFDLATLLHVKGDDREGVVGIGLAPGDNLHGEPYFYVAPWPRPESSERLAKQLPDFPQAGRWHSTEGWFGALLPIPELVKFDEGEDQARVVARYLEQAVGQCRNLLG